MNELRNFFFEVLKTFPEPRVVANFLLTDVLGTLNEKIYQTSIFSS